MGNRAFLAFVDRENTRKKIVKVLSDKVAEKRDLYRQSEKATLTSQIRAQGDYLTMLVQYFDARERMDSEEEPLSQTVEWMKKRPTCH